ncbi:BQ2448_6295 [Microbotryum intermedium]|uniref:BQ2448_6295 protein n=1 Tax=Microbotryum intermedium TaxID=269621 RepID=A0A238FL27_9BASI|nr:BQ2448_6295 [Microbotryum intermedium]
MWEADVFLLSETGRPTPERVAQWTQECRDLKLSALFTPLDNTAILWKSDSPVVTIDPESPSNFLRASFAFPARISDATFRVGDSKVRVVSTCAPSSDKPDKKRLLSHLSTTLRRAMCDGPSFFIYLIDFNNSTIILVPKNLRKSRRKSLKHTG